MADGCVVGACADVQAGGDSQAATLDSLSKKLSDDLRQHIKSLGSFSLLSKEWLTTVRGPRHRQMPTLTRQSACSSPCPRLWRSVLAPVSCTTLIICASCLSAG